MWSGVAPTHLGSGGRGRGRLPAGDDAPRGWTPSEERHAADHMFPKVTSTVFRLSRSFFQHDLDIVPIQCWGLCPLPLNLGGASCVWWSLV